MHEGNLAPQVIVTRAFTCLGRMKILNRIGCKAMSLKLEIQNARKTVKTDKLQLSISEIISMYENEELNIQPEFQRLFRWSTEKKSNLIESILIDIPVPSIFVYENEDGTWELVDGLQRMSTIFEFFGVLKLDGSDTTAPPSALQETMYLSSLKNAVWETSEQIQDIGITDQVPLEKPQQLAIRRSRLDVQVLKQPSDVETKFHLFQRLNRGGAYANAQEVRTCAMVMSAPSIVAKIRKLATNPRFVEMTSLKEESIQKQKDVEYIVRLMVHAYIDYDNVSDVEEFLDEQIIEVLKLDNFDEFESNFDFVVDVLYTNFGAKALFPNAGTSVNQGARFSLRSLEAVFVGLLRNAQEIQDEPNPTDFVKKRVKKFWKNKTKVDAMSASGLRGTQRLQRTIPFGNEWFKP